MKILVQKPETKSYLSAGGWVTTAAEAEDFVAILRAYKFAQQHTSGRFVIVLYCPEDEYVAHIIGGSGLAQCEPVADAVRLPVYSLDAEGEMTATMAARVPKAARSAAVAVANAAPRFELN